MSDPQLERQMEADFGKSEADWELPKAEPLYARPMPHSEPVSVFAEAAPRVIPFIEDNLTATRQAYDKWSSALAKFTSEQHKLFEAKAKLVRKRAFLLNECKDPKDLGANEAQREARLSELTFYESEQVRLLEGTIILLRGEEEIAKIAARLCDQTLKHIEASIIELAEQHAEV